MKKKTKQKTPEQIAEQKQQQLAFQLNELRERFVPELNPNSCRFNVGDRVTYGNIKHSTVTEVLDGNKIYKLHDIVTENNYGRPYDHERDIYMAWMDIQPYRTKEELDRIESFTDKEAIDVNFSNRHVGSIIHTLYHSGIDLNADYQRGSVWELEDKVSLINSIFRGIDIGKFVIIPLPYKDNSPAYEMLDGKQRLEALLGFYEGKFKFKDKLFWELNFIDQNTFENHPIAWGETREKITQKQKYDYFLRLNTTGKPQDPKHLEKVRKLMEST